MDQRITIRSVSRHMFDKFAPARSVIATTILEEIEWFADVHEVVIGTVARDKFVNEWSVCIFGPDTVGRFRPLAAATGMASLGEARNRLLDGMKGVLATGGVVLLDAD